MPVVYGYAVEIGADHQFITFIGLQVDFLFEDRRRGIVGLGKV